MIFDLCLIYLKRLIGACNRICFSTYRVISRQRKFVKRYFRFISSLYDNLVSTTCGWNTGFTAHWRSDEKHHRWWCAMFATLCSNTWPRETSSRMSRTVRMRPTNKERCKIWC